MTQFKKNRNYSYHGEFKSAGGGTGPPGARQEIKTGEQLPSKNVVIKAGDSSGCIEVYASCVNAAFSLLTTRGLLWLYRSLFHVLKLHSLS